MYSYLDFPLISAFIEHWQPDMSTFHLPLGEITIMLHDGWQIIRVPFDGRTVRGALSSDELYIHFEKLL